MRSLWRAACIVALIVSAVAGVVRFALAAQGEVTRGPAPLPHAVSNASSASTPPPLPFGNRPSTTQTMLRSTGRVGMSGFTERRGLKRPAVPTVQQALRKLSGKRSVRNASGGSVVLIGTQNVPFLGGFTYVWDGTLQYGNTELLQCQNLSPSTNYEYVVFAPKAANSAYTSASQKTDTSGNCPTGNDPSVTFSTPFGSGTDPSYSSVWTVAMLNMSTGNYDSITYVVVLGTQTITTSTDSAGSFPSSDFHPGDTIYVQASGLNASDNFALGFQYTAAPPIQCRYTLPTSTTPRAGPCFNNGTTVTGIAPTGGSLTAGWVTSTSGGTTPGTYQVVLQDTTLNETVGTTQVSIQPSTYTWTLTPYHNTTAGTNLNDTFAFAGYADQSVTGADFTVGGLGAVAGNSLKLAISDPNGVVLIAPVTKTAAATTDFGTVTFPLKTASTIWGYGPFYPSVDVFGPTATRFDSNVLTAQVYNSTSGAVLASKSFKLEAYNASLAWTTPNVSMLQAASTGTTATVTITNPATTIYGPQNGDDIKGITLSNDGNETLGLAGGVTSTTVTDSASNVWNVNLVGGQIQVTPQNASITLTATTSIPLPIVVFVPAGNCTTGQCAINTSILPRHGIAYSAVNSVSNKLPVSAVGASASSSGTFGWLVTGGPAPIGTPRTNTMTYLQGTGGTAASALYTLQLTLNNTSTNTCESIASAELTLPPTFSANNVTLSSVSVSGNTCTGVCGWIVTSATIVDPAATGNQLYIWDSNTGNPCSNSPSGNYIPAGNSATFTFSFPMWTTSYAYTPTSIQANPDGGCPSTVASANCTGANALQKFAMKATGTTTTSRVPNTSTLDSTNLAVYSLNPQLMSGVFSPSPIPSGAATATTWTFTNTPTSADPNPDYVDQITLTTPTGMVPDSITGLPANWGAYKTGANTWVLTLCGSATCTPTVAQDQYAIAPGATLAAKFNYTSTYPVNNTYTMNWTVVGANGGATSSSGSSTLIVNSTSATVGFTGSGGLANYPSAAPTPVPNGAEPTTGSDADKTYGNSYAYTITNTGNTTITAATITVPYQDRYYVTAPSPYFTITKAPYVSGAGVGTAGQGCNGTIATTAYASSTGSANGNITLTNCNLKPGQAITVTWDMLAPYSIGSEYAFPAVLNPGASQANATAAYTAANFLKIILDARLAIITPPSGTGTSLAPGPGASNPTTSCLNCVVNAGASPATINFGSFAGTFTTADLINASVTSDANAPDGWQLYVSADQNPTTSSGNLLTMVSSHSNPATGGFTLNQTSYAAVPTTAPGLLLSTFNGSVVRAPIDSVMNYQVSVGSTLVSQPETVTLTYTLIVQ